MNYKRRKITQYDMRRHKEKFIVKFMEHNQMKLVMTTQAEEL